MTKTFYITAAPVGAVPKFIDPLEPKFIPGFLLDHCVVDEARGAIVETLKREGWEAAPKGGIVLQAGYDTGIHATELQALPDPQAGQAAGALADAGWRLDDGRWRSPYPSTKPETPPVIAKRLLERLKSRQLIRQLVLQLTTFGWVATDAGDLTWQLERIQSYLPPELVQQIEADDAGVLEALLALGWRYSEAGLWQPGRARSPYLPITPQHIVEDSRQSLREGAAIVHLHTRAADDQQQLRIPGLGADIAIGAQRNQIVPDHYDAIIPALSGFEPSAILNLSTSARGDRLASESPLRRAHLKHYAAARAVPDLASFSPGPVVFQGGGGYDNPNGFLVDQLAHLRKTGVRPEIEVFNHTIVENATSIYRGALEDSGVPVLFMLVAGVDQHRRDPVNGELDDDSLIGVEVRKQIGQLLQAEDPESKALAVQLVVEQLAPTVQRLRAHFAAPKISVLLPGPFQAILVDVAIALDLDGIRVGLEDALNVFDERVPGGVRRARGTGEQVRALRLELESRGISIINAEALRDQIGMTRADIALFRRASVALAPFLPRASVASDLPSSTVLIEALAPLVDEYRSLEADCLTQLEAGLDQASHEPRELAAWIRETAYTYGVNIRFFIEELDRYADHEHLVFGDVYIPQALNFARELFAQNGRATTRFDAALERYAQQGGTVTREGASYRIAADQFKSPTLRLLEYLVSVSCRYNSDRTNVFNLSLRLEPDYSATMALLFHATRDLTLQLRERSHAHHKASGAVWSVLNSAADENQAEVVKPLRQVISANEVPGASVGIEWIVLPSTPTTHYPLGLKLSNGLSATFYDYLARVARDTTLRGAHSTERSTALRLLGIAHSGRQRNGETVIEASMLYNRFALNADRAAQLFNDSSQLIYERLILPRLVEQARELHYREDQSVARDTQGFPLYKDGSRARRIASAAIGRLTFLKLLAHSSGISTAQQLDVLTRLDGERLGFSADELRAVFDRALVISFASASDVHLDWPGTSVIDITAFNDIRSLAGTTTPDYLPQSGAQLAALLQTLRLARADNLPSGHSYSRAVPLWRRGAAGKTLLRLSDVFLLDDPLRLHDGHSIRRYLEASPTWLRQWFSLIYHAPAASGASVILRELGAPPSAAQPVKEEETETARLASVA